MRIFNSLDKITLSIVLVSEGGFVSIVSLLEMSKSFFSLSYISPAPVGLVALHKGWGPINRHVSRVSERIVIISERPACDACSSNVGCRFREIGIRITRTYTEWARLTHVDPQAAKSEGKVRINSIEPILCVVCLVVDEVPGDGKAGNGVNNLSSLLDLPFFNLFKRVLTSRQAKLKPYK